MPRTACLLLVLPFLVSAAEKPPPWKTDLGAALAEARASGKPVFVVFRCEH